jgi:hypothetical protein
MLKRRVILKKMMMALLKEIILLLCTSSVVSIENVQSCKEGTCHHRIRDTVLPKDHTPVDFIWSPRIETDHGVDSIRLNRSIRQTHNCVLIQAGVW